MFGNVWISEIHVQYIIIMVLMKHFVVSIFEALIYLMDTKISMNIVKKPPPPPPPPKCSYLQGFGLARFGLIREVPLYANSIFAAVWWSLW